jgi:hypothetical protein
MSLMPQLNQVEVADSYGRDCNGMVHNSLIIIDRKQGVTRIFFVNTATLNGG